MPTTTTVTHPDGTTISVVTTGSALPDGGATNPAVAALVAAYAAADQAHVTASLTNGGATPDADFLAQLDQLDPTEANDMFERAKNLETGALESMAPLPDIIAAKDAAKYVQPGLEHIAAGRVGMLLLAGGQGTRLGFDHPKGMFDIGLPSGSTLFELQAARIRAAQTHAIEKCGGSGLVKWYIMTSAATDADTKAYFEQNKYFGLIKDQVFFFMQGSLPCMSFEGKVLLGTPISVQTAPNGNGGLYQALDKSGALQHMSDTGVEYVLQYGVDNALVKMADPAFVGFVAELDADCGAKVCAKAHAHEKVGVICMKNGKPAVVEYSEIDAATAEKTNDDGSLTYSACHLCMNYFSRKFLVRSAAELWKLMPLHVAKKKIPYFDLATGTQVEPTEPNGIKMELFIFDTFPFSEKFAAYEVDRAEEFGPVKNKSGNDSPASALAMIDKINRTMSLAAGATIEGEGVLELDSELLCQDEAELKKQLGGRTISIPADSKGIVVERS